MRAQLTTGDMYRLASDFAAEYGRDACDFAWRAVVSLEAEGQDDRAYFWYILLVLLGDIVSRRVDPDARIIIH